MICVSIELSVNDEQSLREGAHHAAVKAGDDAEAMKFLDREQSTPGDCAQYLLDPGMLPGCNIFHSEHNTTD